MPPKKLALTSDRLSEVLAGLTEALNADMPASVVDKQSSILHNGIALGFDLGRNTVEDVRALVSHLSIDIPSLKLPSGKDYLENFATTIGTEIAIPTGFSVEQRLLTVPHEWVHVYQHKRGVDAGWWPTSVSHSVLYLCSFSTKDAAEYLGKVEADAYATTECVRKFLYGGGLRPIVSITKSLRDHYALMTEGAQVAEQVLLTHYKTMDTGGIPNVTGCRIAMDYLQKNAKDLQGSLV